MLRELLRLLQTLLYNFHVRQDELCVYRLYVRDRVDLP